MIADRQRRTDFSIQCGFVDADGTTEECDLDLGTAKLHLKGGRIPRLLGRMDEAKRRRCGKFRIVLEFPAYQIPMLKFERMRRRQRELRCSSSEPSPDCSSGS
jgi:hypothetical protein